MKYNYHLEKYKSLFCPDTYFCLYFLTLEYANVILIFPLKAIFKLLLGNKSFLALTILAIGDYIL